MFFLVSKNSIILQFQRVRIVSSGVDDVASCRSMKRLQQEVDAIKSASNCKQIVQFYGITFHEVCGVHGTPRGD